MKTILWQTLRTILLPVLLAGITGLIAMSSSVTAEDYLGPESLTASKDGKTLYVACKDSRQVAFVETGSRRLLKSLPLPGEPSGLVLAPDGSKLYVACAAPKSVVCVIDTGSGSVLAKIPAGHTATGLAITPDGKRLFVCNRFNANVAVVDLNTNRQIATVPVIREPVAAVTAPDGKTVFVANLLPLDRANGADVAACVSAIDTATLKTTNLRLPNGSTSLRGLAVSPDGGYLYAVHVLGRYQMPTTQLERGWMNTNALSIFDLKSQKLLNTVLLDDVDRGAANPWSVATTSDGKLLCITHAGTHELSVIDVEGLLGKLKSLDESIQNEVPYDLAFLVDLRRRISFGGNGPRGLTIVGTTAYAAEFFSDAIGEIDLKSKSLSPCREIVLQKPSPDIRRRGEMLFNDATICFQHWQSCVSCHPDARVDGLNWDLVNDGLGNPKNTRSLILSHQSGPVMSLGVRESAHEAVRAGIRGILFATRPEKEAEAIDEYLSDLRPIPSPYRIEGKLSPAAERGKILFFTTRIGCFECHPQPLYTDKKSHMVNSSGPLDKPTDRFNTPRLLEAWRTAPYMHDGQYLSIKELIVEGKHGGKGGEAVPMTEQEIDDLVEYVLSL